MAVDRYEDQLIDLTAERLVELPARLETGIAIGSPVFVGTWQNALALNAVNIGGNQVAGAANFSNTVVNVANL